MGQNRWVRLSGDEGSAVAEFALLAIPLCFSAIACANYCLNVYFDTILRSSAISTARFASLADTTIAQAKERSAEVCSSLVAQVAAKCDVSIELVPRQLAKVQISYKPMTLLVFEPAKVNIVAAVGLESSK